MVGMGMGMGGNGNKEIHSRTPLAYTICSIYSFALA